MTQLHPYQYTPMGSISLVSEQSRVKHSEQFYFAPGKLRTLLSSPSTGAFVRGLGKTYDIPLNECPKIAQAIFFIAIGEKSLAQLPAILSTELKLPNDKAQKMAAEIEKDVFGPVKAELDEFLRKQKTQSGSMAGKLNAPSATSGPTSPEGFAGRSRGRGAYAPQNVLNLKELPARPPQKDFPVRPATTNPLQLPLRKGESTRVTPPYEGGARGGSQPPVPKFPLPPKTPPESPIYFS